MRCEGFGAAARREEREYPHGSLTDEQRSGGDKDPQPAGQVSGGCLAALLLSHRGWRLCAFVAPCHPAARSLRTHFLFMRWVLALDGVSPHTADQRIGPAFLIFSGSGFWPGGSCSIPAGLPRGGGTCPKRDTPTNWIFSVAGIDFSIQQTEKLLSGVINLPLSEASTYLSNLGTAWDSFSAHPISPFHRPSNC